jgi:alpha-glucosidase
VIEAVYLARCMLQNVPDVVQALAATPMRIAVMATAERTLDVPEHRDLNFLQYGRCRGVGGTDARPASSCAEENLLSCPGDPYWAENIFVHEFAHTVHQMGLNRVNESFSRLLRQIFEQAMEDGLWHDAEPDSKGDTAAYAAENEVEYWAEGVQSYFGCNSRIRDTSHNDVNGRDRLQEYDPRLYDLIAQMLGDNPWNYVPAVPRWDQPHLRGLDRQTLPRFAWLATDPPANP